MSRLENALNIRLKGKKTQISSPKNCQTVELEFGTEKVAKTVGKLAAKFSNFLQLSLFFGKKFRK